MRETKYRFYRDSMQQHCSLALTNNADPKAFDFLEKYVPKGSYVLAIGCADGSEVKGLELAGYKATGITLGDNNVKYGKEKFGDIDIRVMDFHDLQFPSEAFDALYSSHSFEHYFNPVMGVLENWTVLKPNGYWFTKHPYFDPTAEQTHNLSYHHPNLNSPEWQRNLFDMCSFEVVEYNRVGAEDRWWLRKKIWVEGIHSSIRECLDNRRNKTF